MSSVRPTSALNQAGFSMVELMVALVLGLFVTTAVLQTFLGAKKAYEFQQEFSRIQENGRFAMEFLSRDIRQADYWGCLSDSSSIVANVSSAVDSGVEGFDAIPASSSGYAPVLGPLADGFLMRRINQTGVKVEKIVGANVHLDKTTPFAQGDTLIASDCSIGASFIISAKVNPSDKVIKHGLPPSGGGAGMSPLGIPNVSGYDVYTAVSTRYWLRLGVSGEPTLVRGTATDAWDSGGVELVEGVENFQILYGVDVPPKTGTPNYFVAADQVSAASTSMDDVVSVQIHLLLRSLRDNMLDEPQALEYYGLSRIANDRRIRKAFTTTLALRNRLN